MLNSLLLIYFDSLHCLKYFAVDCMYIDVACNKTNWAREEVEDVFLLDRATLPNEMRGILQNNGMQQFLKQFCTCFGICAHSVCVCFRSLQMLQSRSAFKGTTL